MACFLMVNQKEEVHNHTLDQTMQGQQIKTTTATIIVKSGRMNLQLSISREEFSRKFSFNSAVSWVIEYTRSVTQRSKAGRHFC